MKVLSIISIISSSLNLTYSSYKITCTGDISNHLLQWFPRLFIYMTIMTQFPASGSKESLIPCCRHVWFIYRYTIKAHYLAFFQTFC